MPKSPKLMHVQQKDKTSEKKKQKNINSPSTSIIWSATIWEGYC